MGGSMTEFSHWLDLVCPKFLTWDSTKELVLRCIHLHVNQIKNISSLRNTCQLVKAALLTEAYVVEEYIFKLS